MKRLLTWLSACAVLLCSLPVTVWAQTSDNISVVQESGQSEQDTAKTTDNALKTGTATGNLNLTLRFSCPQQLDKLEGKELYATLLKGENEEVWSCQLTQDLTFEVPQNAENLISVSAGYLNEFGEVLTTESSADYFQVQLNGLSVETDYQVKLTGKGFADYLSEPFQLNMFSKQLVVDTSSNSFSLGDINGDNTVDNKDMEVMEGALHSEESAADINQDGVVDITDIAYLHRQMYALGEAEFFDTTLIAENAVTVETDSFIVSEGTAQDLLRPDTPAVTLTKKEGQEELTIPVAIEENLQQELTFGQIVILSPQTNGAVEAGEATIYYEEDGEEVSEVINFSNEQPEGVHTIFREAGQNKVVISLGRQVAVKRIVITVTKVQGSDTAEFAVIDEIQFLKDIVPENPVTDSAVPKGILAEPGDGSVSLSWTPVRNVTGYLVTYRDENGKVTGEAASETAEITISGLKNLDTYYFVIYSTSGEWRSAPSAEITAVPQPASVPLAPGNVRLGVLDQALKVNWGKTKNAVSYNVYYRESEEESQEFRKANEEPLTDLETVITGLENGKEYTVYATAVNTVGESAPSVYASATPMAETVEIPQIPTLHRIPNTEIKSVVMENANNVAKDQYPDGFDVNNVVDEDYNTHWTARAWWESSGFTYTFDEGITHTMDYLVYVPRIDGNYKKSLSQYVIKAWDKEDNLILEYNSNGPSLDIQSRADGYAVLTFPKTENIHKIYVKVTQWSGSPTNISLSEIAFYDYYSLNERIQALFTDSSYTSLADGVTEAQIAELEAEISDVSGYFVDRAILQDEIGLARSLYEGHSEALGRVLDGVESRNTKGDIKVINTFQPLGVVANAGKQVVIYAQIPEGEKVSVVPTQYFAEAISWAGGAISLQNGRNVITIPQLTTIAGEKGGALYLQYAGSRQDEIKIQVRGQATSIPVLELSDLEDMTEQQIRERIGSYVTTLTDYFENQLNNKMGGKPQTYIRNSTEISLPNVLLSIPANQVYNALKKAGSTMEEKVEILYLNAYAWQDLIQVLYQTHGIDDPFAEHSRHNIRYARMTGDAFMYASGAHIGIGYGSAAALVQGKPIRVTGQGNANKLFGWGIAHEIGHVMDTLGKAEITNNIYSMFGQTYDGSLNTATSRLEGGKYESIFQKTAIGAKGAANDVFVSLGMYWQLHLAYDGADDNFYNLLNKAYRAGKGQGFTGDEKFAVVASEIAGKNLTEFFTRWGIALSDEAKTQMSSWETESRQIWYLNDNSRRTALAGTKITASGTPVILMERQGRELNLIINGMTGTEQIQGYEISRNGKPIAFTTNGTYTDVIGSANHISIQYTVKVVDILGNVIGTGSSEPFVLSVNNIIDRSFWNGVEQEDGSYLITFQGVNIPEVSGIYLKGKPINGDSSGENNKNDGTVSGNVKGSSFKTAGDQKDLSVTVSQGDSDGRTIIQVSEDGSNYQKVLERILPVTTQDMAYLFFRGTDDGSVGFYQAKTMVISGLPQGLTLDDIEFIAYPGDSIALDDTAVGILSQDLYYGEGEEDKIAAGSMIVTGTYSGDPVYNTIHVVGRYETYSSDSLEGTTVERPVNGEVILFAPVTEGQDMAEIHNGIWIFVPDEQKEQELQEETCTLSALPSQIKAQLYRTDDPYSADSKRLVSDTLWLMMPERDSMPEIEIQ